jgi:uncharacterized protein
MKSYFVFRSENNNYYLFSRFRNKVLYISPDLSQLLDTYDTKEKLNKIIAESENDDYSESKFLSDYKLSSIHSLTLLKVLYKNSYFEEFDYSNKFSVRHSPNSISTNIVNTSQIVFEITDNCNLDCDYCVYGKYYSNYDKRSKANIDFRLIESFINYMHELWNTSKFMSFKKEVAIGFYGGEPLLNFDAISRTVELLESKFIDSNIVFRYSMTTNGLLLNKYIDYLVEKNFAISISLDGNENNNVYRMDRNGISSFKRVFKNIKEIELRYPDFFRTNVLILSVLHDKNSFSDIHSFFSEIFNKDAIISEISTKGINPELQEEYLLKFKNKYQDYYRALQDGNTSCANSSQNPDKYFLSGFVRQYGGGVFENYNAIVNLGHEKYIPTGTCMPLYKKIFISINGKIFPCERVGNQYVMGVVSPDTVKFNNEETADHLNSVFEELYPQCTKCYSTQNCLLCIYCLDQGLKKTECDQFMTLNSMKLYFSKMLTLLEHNPSQYKEILMNIS